LLTLFRYNWLVRDEWFALCEQISPEQLLLERVGGAGGILYTLFHVLDVEYSWIRGIQGKPDIQVRFADYGSFRQVRQLSDRWRAELEAFLASWSSDREHKAVAISWTDGVYAEGEILRHLIAHEIHHMGQLSIWARELGLKPVSANVIGRGLYG